MDPNAALATIREALFDQEAVGAQDEGVFLEAVPLPPDEGVAAARAQDLDAWLMGGGFLPKDWEEHCNGGLVKRALLLKRVAETIRTSWPCWKVNQHAEKLASLYGSIIEGHRDRFMLIEADGTALCFYRELQSIFEHPMDAVWEYVNVTWGDKHG